MWLSVVLYEMSCILQHYQNIKNFPHQKPLWPTPPPPQPHTNTLSHKIAVNHKGKEAQRKSHKAALQVSIPPGLCHPPPSLPVVSRQMVQQQSQTWVQLQLWCTMASMTGTTPVLRRQGVGLCVCHHVCLLIRAENYISINFLLPMHHQRQDLNCLLMKGLFVVISNSDSTEHQYKWP